MNHLSVKSLKSRKTNMILGLLLSIISSLATASTNISVTVDGRTYNCGDGESIPTKYCKCRKLVSYIYYLELHREGHRTIELDRIEARDGTADTQCREALQLHPSCR